MINMLGLCIQRSVGNYNVIQSKNLNAKDLASLFQGNAFAIRIPNFIPRESLSQAQSKLTNKHIIDYDNADGVGKFEDLGMAYFEVENDESRKRYYQMATPTMQKVREVFSPYQSPIDKVRLSLDEVWPHGSSLMNVGNGTMFVGLIRAIKKEILPHEDKLERDDPNAMQKISYVSQIAFNCYLTMPEHGGELQLWDISLPDDRYNALRGKSYGLNRSVLLDEDARIRPGAGELVLFNARKLHAVLPVQGDTPRVSASGFILYQGEDKPLKVWS